MDITVSAPFEKNALTYQSYRLLLEQLMAEGKTTGTHQSPELTHYARLNLARMKRVDKTVEILPAVRSRVLAITEPQHWYVLTEGWCGDAAQTVPAMYAISQLNPHISFSLLLRDENLDLMDQYLQYGTSRSIPKLIARRAADRQELFHWGPRPLALQQIYDELRGKQTPFDVVSETLHRWYAKDKTFSFQYELLELLA
jgi:hypothetical protein